MSDLMGMGGLIRMTLCAIALAFAAAPTPAAAATKCPSGEVPVDGGCMPAGSTYCGQRIYCNSGEYCSSTIGKCVANGNTDCHDGNSCRPGFACAPGGGCIDPHAPARNSSGGCGSDITGTGGGSQRRDCSPARAQVTQQREERRDLRTMLLRSQQQQTPSSYSYSYSYTSSQPVYREDPQVIYEKVKQQCGSTPTTACAAGVIDPDAGPRDRLRDKLLRAKVEAANGPIEAVVPNGSPPSPAGQGGAQPAPASSGSPWTPDEQSLFCHVVLERVQSGDLGFSRDEQIPAECRRDQEIIAALAKAKAEHPFITFAGPDTENEISKLLKPAADQNDAIRNQIPPEPK